MSFWPNRYTGRLYSVRQHSVTVSRCSSPQYGSYPSVPPSVPKEKSHGETNTDLNVPHGRYNRSTKWHQRVLIDERNDKFAAGLTRLVPRSHFSSVYALSLALACMHLYIFVCPMLCMCIGQNIKSRKRPSGVRPSILRNCHITLLL